MIDGTYRIKKGEEDITLAQYMICGNVIEKRIKEDCNLEIFADGNWYKGFYNFVLGIASPSLCYMKPVPESQADCKNDAVNHPSHYTSGNIEVIDFIEDQQLGYHRGNALKYICRAGRKNQDTEAEDLEKAVWYLEREISRIKKGI